MSAVIRNFLFRVWQGLDGRWHVMQPSMIGKSAAKLQGGEYWQYRPDDEWDGLGYMNHVGIDNTPITADADNLSADAELSAEDPIARISVNYADDLRVALNTVDGSEDGMAGDRVQGPAMNLVRDGFFGRWETDFQPTFYEVENGSGGNDVQRETTVTLAGADSAEIMPQGKVKTKLPFIEGSTERFIQFQFYAAQRNTDVGGTDETQRHEFEIILHGETQDWYVTGAGTYSDTWASISTDDYYSQPTSGGTGIQWFHHFVRTVELPPETGWFEIILKGCYYNSTSGATGPGDITQQTTHTVTVDDVGAFPVDDAGAVDNEIDVHLTFELDSAADQVGEHLEIEREWFNWQAYRYNDADGGRAQYAPTIEFWDGSFLDWIQFPAWLEAGGVDEYHTLAEMQVREGWFKQMPRTVDKVRGTIAEAAPPEKAIYVAEVDKYFMALNVTINVVHWLTEGQWIENVRFGEDLGQPDESQGTVITV